MGLIQFSNQYAAELASSITTSSAQLALKSGEGAKFPVIALGDEKYFLVCLVNSAGAREIVKIIQRSSGSDTLIVGSSSADQPSGNVSGRAQEGTSAIAITYTDDHVVELRLTAGIMDAIAGAIPSNVAGMQTVTDPYPAGSASVPADMAGVIQRLQYLIAQITGETYWYIDPSVRTLKSSIVNSIYIPAGMFHPRGDNGAEAAYYTPATNNLTRIVYEFDPDTKKFICLDFKMPEGWNRSTIKAKFDWSHKTGASNGDNVEWEIAAVAMGNNDSLDPTIGTAVTVVDAVDSASASVLRTSPATGAVTVGGSPALNDLIHLRIARKVSDSDNMAAGARLHGVHIQFTESFPDAAGGVAVAAW